MGGNRIFLLYLAIGSTRFLLFLVLPVGVGVKMKRYKENLPYGHAAERDVARIFDLKGYTSWRIKKHNDDPSGKGVEFEDVHELSYSAPDLLVYNKKNARIVEVKHMETCGYYEGVWTVPLSYTDFVKYVEMNNKSQIKLCIVWVVDGGLRDGRISPSGKFCQDIDFLFKNLHSCVQEKNLVFWKVDDLANLHSWSLPVVKKYKVA